VSGGVGFYFGIAGLNPAWVPSATRRSWLLRSEAGASERGVVLLVFWGRGVLGGFDVDGGHFVGFGEPDLRW